MKVTVVMQNDYPAAVFENADDAAQFCERQPQKSINGHPLYWKSYTFEVEERCIDANPSR